MLNCINHNVKVFQKFNYPNSSIFPSHQTTISIQFDIFLTASLIQQKIFFIQTNNINSIKTNKNIYTCEQKLDGGAEEIFLSYTIL